MGRRSLHTADELRELIIEASTALIQEAGLEGLSAREIARRINYSPGTLYNSFENLDDLIFTIEGRLLDGLLEALGNVPASSDPRTHVHKIASCYLKFAAQNPKLWSLIFQHHSVEQRKTPDWYRAKFEVLLSKLEDALRPVLPRASAEELRRSARVLWAGLHGLSSLSATDKLSLISPEDAGALVDDFVSSYLAGLQRERSAAP